MLFHLFHEYLLVDQEWSGHISLNLKRCSACGKERAYASGELGHWKFSPELVKKRIAYLRQVKNLEARSRL